MSDKSTVNTDSKQQSIEQASKGHLRYEHFLKSINNLPGVVLRYEMKENESDRIVFISDQCESIWEVSKEEILSNMQLLWDVIHDEDIPKMQETLRKSAETQSMWELRWRITTPSGKVKWMKGIGEPDRDADGVFWDMFISDITEEYQLQRKISHKSSVLQRTEEIANIGSWEIDLLTDTFFWSDQIYRIFAIPVSEVPPSIEIQRNFFLGNGWEIYKSSFDKAIETGQEIKVGATIKDFSGKTKNIISRAYPLKNEYGEVIKLVGSIQDVTERVDVESKLNDSQVMFRNITNNIPGLVLRYQLNPDGSDQLLFLSKGVEDLFELDVQEARRDVSLLWQRIHPEDLPGYRSSLEHSAEHLEFWDREFRIIMRDGRIKWLNGRGKPFKKEDGTIIWDSIALDITETKSNSEKLRKLKEQLDLAIETAELGVWSYDPKANKMQWNDQMLKIYGLSRKEFDHDPNGWVNQIVEADQKRAESTYEKIKRGEDKDKFDFRLLQPDGTHRYVSSVISGVFVEEELVEVLGVNLDVTDFKEIEEELLKAKNIAENNERQLKVKNDELTKANQELDNFVYRVSHDLRSPITSAIGLTELSLSIDDLDQIHYYDTLRIQTLKKLDRFINEILNYSRNTRMPVQSQKINFENIINTIIAEYSANIEKDNIKIDLVYNCEHTAYGDQLRITTVLDNLLSNAFKFVNALQEETFIKVLVQTSKKEIFIEVEDNGIGIKKDQQSKIFDMFYRASNVGQGSGIGLYILKESLEKINGNLKLESEYGKGTKFSIHIPNSIKDQSKKAP